MQKEIIAPEGVQKKRIINFNYILILFVIAFTALSILAKLNPYFPFDIVITRTIQNIEVPLFADLMILLTKLGNVEWGIIIVIIFAISALLMKRTKDALFILISSAGASLIGISLKLLIGRPRPAEELLLNFPGFLKDTSFPSGHVLSYIGLIGFLLFLFYTQMKNSTLRTTLIITCITLLILIGVSRIYLGAHWFSDTLGSYLIGTIWLSVLAYFYKKT